MIMSSFQKQHENNLGVAWVVQDLFHIHLLIKTSKMQSDFEKLYNINNLTLCTHVIFLLR